MSEPFLKFQTRLLKAEKLTNKFTCVSVNLNLTTKVLFSYMLERYQHFVVREGGKFYENQTSIAENLCINRRTVIENLKLLVNVGAIEVKTIKTHGAMRSNSYIVNDIFVDKKFSLGNTVGYVSNSKEEQKQQNTTDEFDMEPF